MLCNFKFSKYLSILALGAVAFSACNRNPKDDNYLYDDDDRIGYATEASRIEFANNDVISLADQAGLLYNAEYIRESTSTCASVAVDTINTPHTLIIRFGETDCMCADGRKRRGSIIVQYNGRYLDTAEVHTITYNNYHIDGNRLTGWVKTIRVDTTVTGNWYYKVQVNDSMDVNPDPLQTQQVVWNGNLLRRWVGGNSTPQRDDDYFSISGMARLTSPNGHVFDFNIATPLQFGISCDYAQSGVVNVTGYTGNRVLNYGSGSCDNSAQLNVGVRVYQLTLAK